MPIKVIWGLDDKKTENGDLKYARNDYVWCPCTMYENYISYRGSNYGSYSVSHL